MSIEASSPKKAIIRVIKQINEFWLNKQYDEIGELLSEQVVTAPPGFERRIEGRDAYVQSYRDYDQSAQTQEFSPGEPEIDIIENTAVAVCPFYVVYELDGKTYSENGRDILVFSRSSGNWLVVWRTMLTNLTK